MGKVMEACAATCIGTCEDSDRRGDRHTLKDVIFKDDSWLMIIHDQFSARALAPGPVAHAILQKFLPLQEPRTQCPCLLILCCLVA